MNICNYQMIINYKRMQQNPQARIRNILKKYYNRKKSELDLTNAQENEDFDIDYIHRLLNFGELPALKILILTDNNYDIRLSKYLLQKKQVLSGLYQLYLAHNNIKSDGAIAIGKIQFTQLKCLDLNETAIGDGGLCGILGKIVSNQLTVLKLDKNQITHFGLTKLHNQLEAKHPEFPFVNKFKNMKVLSLANNKIGLKGTKVIGKLHMPQLTHLNVDNCFLTDPCLLQICKMYFPKLQKLEIGNNNKCSKRSKSNLNTLHCPKLCYLSTIILESLSKIVVHSLLDMECLVIQLSKSIQLNTYLFTCGKSDIDEKVLKIIRGIFMRELCMDVRIPPHRRRMRRLKN